MVKKFVKKISKAFNKAADKLVPKELAPVLPFLPLIFGPTLGLQAPFLQKGLGRFLIPQLLTGLSSAKQTGEVDPTQQLITGIMTALQSPTQQTAAEKELLKQNPDLLQRAEKANLLEDATRLTEDEFRSLVTSGDGFFDAGPKIEGYSSIDQFIDKFAQPLTGGDPVRFGADAENILKFGTGDDARFFLEGSADLSDFLKTTTQTPVVGLDKLTGQELIDELAKAEGFTAGDISSKLADIQKVQGGEQGLVALNRAKQFFDAPIGFNAPTFAKAGIGASPFLAAQAANMQREAEEQEAEEAAEAERFAGARDDLFDYFRRLSDPRGLFAAMGGRVNAQEGGIMSAAPGMPQGMQVDGRNGTFIPMGVREKADDVPAMLSKNEFVMTADAVRAAGGGDVNKGAQRMYDLMNSLEANV